MNCPRCAHENRAGAKFCEECGARLSLACRHCRSELAPSAKFCPECGEAVSRAAPGPRFASLEAYTPKHLADRILTSKSALEGERKQITVLFADLKGSMELLADRDPEEARKILDPVLELLIEAVHRYEGTVNQVMGDGIMALFGAPLAHEDHAVRACYAALAMQAAIRRHSETLRAAQGLEIQIRVGLNSGDVVVRAIGSDLHMDYTAVGQTTHLAARMEQLATPGTVRLTAETLRLAEGFVAVAPLGPVPVKGLAEPVEVFELTGAGTSRTRLQAAATRGFAQFVGRRAELEMLDEALEHARSGRGRVVALVGEAGVGKSRLLWELTHSRRTEGWLVLEGGSVSYGKATPYLPVIELLAAYFLLDDRDNTRRIREKITGKLLTLDPAFQETLPALLTLFDPGIEERAWRALEPRQRRQATLDAVKRLLLRESQVQPLIVVFEDLHWIDAETQALLDSLVESLPTARILLLVNYRPEYQHGWSNKSHYAQRRVDPLSRADAEELLETLLGTDPELASLKQLLVERTEGNPFFLEESVRTLAETGAITGQRGAYQLAGPLASIQMPPTVQAVLAARIDRLPAEDKWLLQCGSVVGKDVPFAILEAIADLSEDVLHGGLARLRSAEFLYEVSLFPELEYTFKHALTHEVTYGSLLHARRRQLHAGIVEVIERLYPDRRTEHVERLANHALRGEVWDRALVYLRQAGVAAFERSANPEAVAYLEQALEALGHVPDGRATIEAAIDIRCDLRLALFPSGELARIGSYLHEAASLAEGLGDQARLGRVQSYLTNYFLAVGDHVSAVTSGQRALAIAAERGDLDLTLTTSFYLGQLYASTGDYRRGAEVNRRILGLIEGEGAGAAGGRSAVGVISHLWLLWCLAELGEFVEGLRRGTERLRVVEALEQPFELVTASLGLGLLHLRRGDLADAIGRLERALPLCYGGNLAVWFPAVASPLGYAYALADRGEEAVALLERAVESTTARSGGGHALRAAHLAEAYLRVGRGAEAATVGAGALDVARERKERGHEAYARRLLADVALGAGDAERSEEHYAAAIALAEELGMRPLLGRCRLERGMLYRRRSEQARANAEIGAAVDLFRSMDMRPWLARAETARGAAR